MLQTRFVVPCLYVFVDNRNEVKMESETFAEVLEWTQQLHTDLAEVLARAARTNKDERARMLLSYLAEHEVEMADNVAAFSSRADAKALGTHIYHYISHKVIDSEGICSAPYDTMDFDEISQLVFGLHDEVLDLYRTLLEKADIPELATLLEGLVQLEEHQVKLMVTQAGRMNDL